MAESELTQDLIEKVREVYPRCLFDKQCRNIIMRDGFYVGKLTWDGWKNQGEHILLTKAEDIRTDFEQLLVNFFLALTTIGAEVDQRCLENIQGQMENPKNADYNWRVLKLRNKGEYDEKTVQESNVNVSGNIEISLMDALKKARLSEREEK